MSFDIDLFAGPGGWDTGLAMLDVPSPLGIEHDRDAVATARAAGHLRLDHDRADVAALDPYEVAAGRPVRLLIASPPCQAWSKAGKRGGIRDQPRIWDHLAAVRDARRVWIQLSQGRAGQRRRTGWRHYVDPAGSSYAMPDYLDGYVRRMYDAAERLAGVSLESRPALDLIDRYGRIPDRVVLYVDPPYLGTARNSGGYLHDMPDEQGHRDLAAALRACKATVVLSGYPSDLYDLDLYAGWHRTEFGASTGQGGTWANRTEVLWSNRPLAGTGQLAFTDEEVSA